MQEKKPLKYLGYAIVCEEVPDEISLAFNISGCVYKCEGCHSKYLWNYDGRYLSEDFIDILDKYNGLITCVCFLGGDQNMDELTKLCKVIKQRNLKTCIYSGADSTLLFDNLIRDNLLDYLKVGRYILELGGLNSTNTNQIMYKNNNGELEDITFKFNKKYN